MVAIVAALSVAVAPTMISTAMADDPFDGKGDPHDDPGNNKDGNPHKKNNDGNPHRCPDDQCNK